MARLTSVNPCLCRMFLISSTILLVAWSSCCACSREARHARTALTSAFCGQMSGTAVTKNARRLMGVKRNKGQAKKHSREKEGKTRSTHTVLQVLIRRSLVDATTSGPRKTNKNRGWRSFSYLQEAGHALASLRPSSTARKNPS